MVKHYGPFFKVFIVSQNNYIKPQVLYNNLIQFSCAVILNSVLSLVDLRWPRAAIPQMQLRGCICFTACGAIPTTLSSTRAGEFTAIYGMWLGMGARAQLVLAAREMAV